jgi:hypothetical protein
MYAPDKSKNKEVKMADPYEEEESYDYEPRQGMSGWLIALIVALVIILLFCICACAALTLLGPVIGNTFSTIIETLTPLP